MRMPSALREAMLTAATVPPSAVGCQCRRFAVSAAVPSGDTSRATPILRGTPGRSGAPFADSARCRSAVSTATDSIRAGALERRRL
ncbi:MAG: hypothetical protein IPJ21_17465 [Sterolibacteriaceae bacterium]|nr:hypothetical protein [Sterolibacteriaceae bacterium]